MSFYLILKALHLVSVITWFAGIFYLPRLFVYHATAEDQISKDRFVIMETKLYRLIMNPSMIVTLILGIWMLALNWTGLSNQTWIWLKIAFVVALIGYHHYCLGIIKSFTRGEIRHSEKFFRIFNEVPVLILLSVVFLAVLKPF
ncbi:MAG TPA: protoporphyrinogen oxidase HemJ [Gammaproteobacteria bacterium]|nr:protoporphyrinogen oxidase HemJ [Gammaproteobacteria bacterium]|tara:strand:- start:2768 stop:3199 length:432 start_codon:yes stop_codon:yes gene_type:complete